MHCFYVPKNCIIKESLMKNRFDMTRYAPFIWNDTLARA